MKAGEINEAKTHFSELVAARAGQTIVITRNGEPVAQIVPGPAREGKPREAMDRILSTRAKLEGTDTKTLIEEGRRH
jgi:antitoxin (DNA-binding transcriptional repressor) of toxin-antitoxin stability system